MSPVEDEVVLVTSMIQQLPLEGQRRVEFVANILRDLINAEEGGHEVELAFTLVLAERSTL